MTSVFPDSRGSHPRTPAGPDWQVRRKVVASKVTGIGLVRGVIRASLRPAGYRVTLEGEQLHRALSPPRVTVGGLDLVDLRFHGGGLFLEGFLPRRPPDRQAIVDYGFARAEITLDQHFGWWLWIRPLLLEPWSWIDAIVRRLLSLLP